MQLWNAVYRMGSCTTADGMGKIIMSTFVLVTGVTLYIMGHIAYFKKD